MTHEDFEAYALGDLDPARRQLVEQHLASNPDAALEVERLRAVVAALKRLPEEEPPRRIAFVSDKVFEPRWYHQLWGSAARLGFASAAMLAFAILGHGWLTKAPPVPAAASVSLEAIERSVEAEVARRLPAAVETAASQIRSAAESESSRRVAVALEAAEKKFALERQADRLAVEASMDVLRKQMNRLVYFASNQRGGSQ